MSPTRSKEVQKEVKEPLVVQCCNFMSVCNHNINWAFFFSEPVFAKNVIGIVSGPKSWYHLSLLPVEWSYQVYFWSLGCCCYVLTQPLPSCDDPALLQSPHLCIISVKLLPSARFPCALPCEAEFYSWISVLFIYFLFLFVTPFTETFYTWIFHLGLGLCCGS